MKKLRFLILSLLVCSILCTAMLPSAYADGIANSILRPRSGESAGKPSIVQYENNYDAIIALRSDGRICGYNLDYLCAEENLDKLLSWTNIVKFCIGNGFIIGLKSDGTLEVVGSSQGPQADVEDWENIVDIFVCSSFTAGLRSDGTVAITRDEYTDLYDGTAAVENWKDIVSISAATCGDGPSLMALSSDGKVYTAGMFSSDGDDYGYGLDEPITDGVYIDTSGWANLCIRKDGSFVAWGIDKAVYSEAMKNEKDLIQVCAGDTGGVGLRRDGSLCWLGSSGNSVSEFDKKLNSCKNVARIYFWDDNVVAIKHDGSTEVILKEESEENLRFKQAMEKQRNIESVDFSYGSALIRHKDGSTEIVDVHTNPVIVNNLILGTEYSCLEPMDTGVAALTSSGKVIYSGPESLLPDGAVDTIASWENVQQICHSWKGVLALNTKGQVMAVGNNDNGQFDLSGWKNISAIACTPEHSYGLLSNGKVLTAGRWEYEPANPASQWTNVTSLLSVTCGEGSYVFGLRSDGRVEDLFGHTKDWQNVVSLSSSGWITLGLKSDGTVLGCGEDYKKYQQEISSWKDVVQVCAGDNMAIALKKDGTLLLARDGDEYDELLSWRGIKSIFLQPELQNTFLCIFNDGSAAVYLPSSTSSGEWRNIYRYKNDTLKTWEQLESIHLFKRDEHNNNIIALRSDGKIYYK